MKLLIKAGADINSNINSNSRIVPVHSAAKEGHIGVVELLLQAGCKPVEGDLPMHSAAISGKWDIVELFLRFGSAINRDGDDGALIHTAAAQDRVDIMGRLVEQYGAEVDAARRDGMTPLHIACREGYTDMVQWLLSTGKVDVNRGCEYAFVSGIRPLHFALQAYAVTIVRFLLAVPTIDADARNSRLETPLHNAAASVCTESARLLLDTEHVDVNARNITSRTPLHEAFHPGSGTTYSNHRVPLVRELLKRSELDLDAQDTDGLTPLHLAMQCGDQDVAQLLLDTGKVDQTVVNRWARTPVQYAVQYGSIDVLKMLSKTGRLKAEGPEYAALMEVASKSTNAYRDVLKFLVSLGKH